MFIANFPSFSQFSIMSSLHPMLNTAIKAARKAGAIINRGALDIERLQVSKKGHNDFVTEIDAAAEQAIIEVLLGAYPAHTVLGEESGRVAGAAYQGELEQADYVWIIDPLDGTTNFIHGFPQYAVSIALQHKGQIQHGVIYDPTRNELFTATRGRGAFLNERRLRVSACSKLSEALLGTGFPFRAAHDNPDLERYMKLFGLMAKRCAGIRRPGAAALDLAYVAAGRFDGFWEAGLKPWDIAAGALLVSESGGLVSDWQGESGYLNSGEVIAGTPKVLAQIVASIKET